MPSRTIGSSSIMTMSLPRQGSSMGWSAAGGSGDSARAAASGTRIANRVGRQVQHDSFEQDEVTVDPCIAGHDPQPKRFLARGVRESRLQPGEKIIDGKSGEVRLENVGVELRDIQQRVEQLVHRRD